MTVPALLLHPGFAEKDPELLIDQAELHAQTPLEKALAAVARALHDRALDAEDAREEAEAAAAEDQKQAEEDAEADQARINTLTAALVQIREELDDGAEETAAVYSTVFKLIDDALKEKK